MHEKSMAQCLTHSKCSQIYIFIKHLRIQDTQFKMDINFFFLIAHSKKFSFFPRNMNTLKSLKKQTKQKQKQNPQNQNAP